MDIERPRSGRPHNPDKHQRSHRPREQLPPSRERRKKRSANNVRSNPANPIVISSIISSLDTLAPPPRHDIYSDHSSLDERISRPGTSDGSYSQGAGRLQQSTTAPSLTGGGFGMDYGAFNPRRGDDCLSDGAEFPTIPTSKRHASHSTHSARRTPPNSSLTDYLRSASIRSNSSCSLHPHEKSRDRASSESRRGSFVSESWKRRQSSPSNISLNSATGKGARRSMISSPPQDTLQVPDDKTRKRAAVRVANVALLTQTLARVPDSPKSWNGGAKGEPRVGDDVSMQRPQQLRKSLSGGPAGITKTPSKAQSNLKAPEERTSPVKHGPIADAIPLRTSSLHHLSASPKKTKRPKSSKSKKKTEPAMKRAVKEQKSEPTPEPWEELGEEDQTVRRIRELRQQKENRLRGSALFPEDFRVLSSPASEPLNEATLTSAQAIGNANRASGTATVPRPVLDTNRSLSAPDSSKAHKLLGITEASVKAPTIGAAPITASNLTNTAVDSPASAPARRTGQPVDHLTSPSHLSSHLHATRTPHLSLKHSYTNAVNALGDVTNRSTNQESKHAHAHTTRNSRVVDGLDLEGVETRPVRPTLNISTSLAQAQVGAQVDSPSNRGKSSWAHTDIPSPSIRKGKRKSMNDARVNEEQFLAERRDSIDEAVEHYLHNPRLSRAVRHPTSGRIISFSDVGDPDGAAVIVCVGMGLTRYVAAFYDELAITLHLRLITLDRPGVGGSDPYPEGDRSGPLSWPDDVSTVCNHLGISHFSVLAHSAGAIYALATALILPHCVRGKVHLLAPWVPPSQLESIGRQPDAAPVGSLPRSQRLLRVLPTPFLKAANSGFMAGAAASLKPSNRRRSPRSPHHDQPAHYDGRRDNTPSRKTKKRPEALRRESLMLMDQVPPMQPSAHTFALATVSKDDDDPSSDMHGLRRPSLKLSATATPTEADFSFAFEALHAAEHAARERQAVYSTLLTERTWVLATQNSNPAVDLVVCLERNRTIGFRYVDITKEVVITHGSEDKRVPVENVRWIGEQMSRRSLAGMNEEAGWDSESIRKRRGGCEVRVLPGEGHGLMASAGVMSDVLSEIAADGTAWRITDRKE